MTDCVFCKITTGEIKTPGIFWDNENHMAFLSTSPSTEGFTVVIPKEHYPSDVLKMPNDILSEFILAAKEVSGILENYFPDVGRVGLIMEGTGIDHAHIKLFPMHGTEHMKAGEWRPIPSHYDEYYATYPGYIASNDGPRGDDDELSKLAEGLRSAIDKS